MSTDFVAGFTLGFGILLVLWLVGTFTGITHVIKGRIAYHKARKLEATLMTLFGAPVDNHALVKTWDIPHGSGSVLRVCIEYSMAPLSATAARWRTNAHGASYHDRTPLDLSLTGNPARSIQIVLE